jgi:hypothetical protein
MKGMESHNRGTPKQISSESTHTTQWLLNYDSELGVADSPALNEPVIDLLSIDGAGGAARPPKRRI